MSLTKIIYLIRKFFKKLQRIIWSWINSPEKDLRPEMETMPTFRKNLHEVALIDNRLKAVVALFAVLSPFYEQKNLVKLINKLNAKNYGQLDQILISLSTIQTKVNQCVNAYSGVYRAQEDEVVTDKNIWLGGLYGIYSRPVAYWLEKKEESDNDKKLSNNNQGMPSNTWYLIYDYQAGRLLDFGAQIAQEIDKLQTAYQAAGFKL